MVSFTDLKGYKSSGSGGILGGAIDTGDEVNPSTPGNLFENVERNRITSGDTTYYCMYFKNTSAEDMDDFKIWLSTGTRLGATQINWGFDGVADPRDGAIGFDGTNDYLDCGNHSDLWSKSLSKFSFSLWIYPRSWADGNTRYVVNHGSGSAQGFRLDIDSSVTSRITFVVKNAANANKIAQSNGVLDLNTWNHVICSYDNSLGADNVIIYVNGTIGGTKADLTETINQSSILTLADSSTDFKGYIKDFKFWDDQAISTTEAEDMFNGDFDTEPAYHLNFGEGTGSTAKDSSGGTKTATFVNGTFWKKNAMDIADKFEEPSDVKQWYKSGDKPGSIGTLHTGEYFPIWLRLELNEDDNGSPAIDDSCVFTMEFDITSSNTATPGTGTGGTSGTGGGTGGTPTPVSNWKICFAGDWGCESETNDAIDLIKQQNYDLVVGVGDNAYESASCWTGKFNTIKSKMESAFGNHEYEESGGKSPYMSFFGYSKTYNSIRFQNALILIIDSNDDKSGVDLDAQKTWAKGELDKYKNDSKVTWRIAVMHHPWFGNGSKHEENEFDQVQKFHKLFTDYKVSFVYVGHNHNWHRSHMVSYNSGSPKSPNIIDSSSPYTRTGGGLMEICSGTGGHDSGGSLYTLPDDASFWAYRNKSHNGVHELVATNNGLTLTGKFRDNSGDTFDAFTITA